MPRLRILIACEFSGIVRDAFLARGHDAWSCDILPSERPGPHYQGEVRDILDDNWDMMVAHPPCTDLSAAGAHLWKTKEQKIAQAFEFVECLFYAPIARVAIENPQGWLNTHWAKPSQTLHPYWFGAPYKKRTCLWLRGLPLLVPTNMLTGTKNSWVNSTNNYRNRFGEGYTNGVARNPHERSRSFPEIAAAMAAQWG